MSCTYENEHTSIFTEGSAPAQEAQKEEQRSNGHHKVEDFWEQGVCLYQVTDNSRAQLHQQTYTQE